ncbi:hypothetical protein F5877DRAFT_72620, partial [Lentinula edodes]
LPTKVLQWLHSAILLSSITCGIKVMVLEWTFGVITETSSKVLLILSHGIDVPSSPHDTFNALAIFGEVQDHQLIHDAPPAPHRSVTSVPDSFGVTGSTYDTYNASSNATTDINNQNTLTGIEDGSAGVQDVLVGLQDAASGFANIPLSFEDAFLGGQGASLSFQNTSLIATSSDPTLTDLLTLSLRCTVP